MSVLRCFHCQAALVDTRFIECPAFDEHRFCFDCTLQFIRENIKAGRHCLYCPSGQKCIIRGFTKPWHFVEQEIAAILPLDEYEQLKNELDRQRTESVLKEDNDSNLVNCFNNNSITTTCFQCDRDLTCSDQVVRCESNDEHNFCYECTTSFICKQGLNEVNCPSGQLCSRSGDSNGKPWYFSMSDIQRILRTPTFKEPNTAETSTPRKESPAQSQNEKEEKTMCASTTDKLVCTSCKTELSAQFVQCPTVKGHKFCLPCTRKSIGQQNCDKSYCPSGAKCALHGAYIPWSFMEFEIKSILTDDEYTALQQKRALAKSPIETQ